MPSAPTPEPAPSAPSLQFRSIPKETTCVYCTRTAKDLPRLPLLRAAWALTDAAFCGSDLRWDARVVYCCHSTWLDKARGRTEDRKQTEAGTCISGRCLLLSAVIPLLLQPGTYPLALFALLVCPSARAHGQPREHLAPNIASGVYWCMLHSTT